MGSLLTIRALGGLDIALDEVPVTGFDSRKVAALLAYLACTGRAHPRDVLAEMLWEARSQAQSLANLRVALSSLRQTAGDHVSISRATVELNPDSAVWLDAAAFEEALAAGCLDQAVELYAGDFLAGFYVDSSEFEAWVLRERERLRLRMHEALDALIGQHLAQGDYATGIAQAIRLLDMDNLREKTHRQLMHLLAQSGEREAALAQYVTCARLLQAELGVSPTAETTALYEQIRAGDIPAMPSPAPVEMRPAAEPSPVARHNLPAQTTPFIGRTQELAAVKGLLAQTRLLTLTGAGGTGKTRLALQAASTLLASFPDGVYFVDLTPIRDPGLVVDAIAHALGVSEGRGKPVIETLKHFLGDQCLLLLLDNFEQVVNAAPDLVELLAAAPRLNILVTSREALRVRGEQEYLVPPLSVPDLSTETAVECLAHYEAVALFVDRASAVRHDFQITADNARAIAAICARLDGLPLAIELAAARVRLFSPEQLLARLERGLSALTGGARDAPARQRTLRDTIDWSYQLLDPSEQVLFARLGVFVGGCTLDAAAAICNTDLPIDILDGLASLLDKSLLRREETPEGDSRFTMLVTIREYAFEQLAASGDVEDLRRRHAAYCLALAEDALPGPLDMTNYWCEALVWEYDNLRAALDWAIERGEADYALRLVHALGWFWDQSGHFSEGWQRAQRALALDQESPALSRIRALNAACWLALRLDDPAGAAMAEEALTLAQETADELAIAEACFACTVVGNVDMPDGRALTRALTEEALIRFRKLDHPRYVARTLNNLGEMARLDGDDNQAEQYYRESLAIQQRYSGQTTLLTPQLNLGYIMLHRGQARQALAMLRETGAVLREQDLHSYSLGLVLLIAAGARGQLGEWQTGIRLLGSCVATMERLNVAFVVLDYVDQYEYDLIQAELRKQCDEATFETLWAEGHAMPFHEALAYVLGEISPTAQG